MTVIRQTCLLILASITIGCGRDADPVPFRTGTMIVLNQSEAAGWTPPEPPDVRVIKPTQRQRFRRGDPIACVATVTLSEGGQLPDFVTAEVQKQGVVYDACSMEPDQKLGGRQYQFKGKMKAPSRTGKYELRVQTTASIIIRPNSDGAKHEHKVFRSFSPQIAIEVTK